MNVAANKFDSMGRACCWLCVCVCVPFPEPTAPNQKLKCLIIIFSLRFRLRLTYKRFFNAFDKYFHFVLSEVNELHAMP